MPRQMKQDAPEAFRLVINRIRPDKEGNPFDSTHYFGPYATPSAAKGQVRRATESLGGSYYSSEKYSFKARIERTESAWATHEDLGEV